MPTARSTTRARHALLVSMVAEGITSVVELAGRLDISESTVRRDLARLKQQGQLERTYGGAVPSARFQERSIDESRRRASPEKARIARAVLDLMPQEGCVFLDAGTTCGAVARLLADSDAHQRLIVTTRGLETALALVDSPGIEVVMLGGTLRRLSHGLIGPLTGLALDRLVFDLAVLGADAVDPARGVGEPTLTETDVKEQVARRSERTVVVADASKLGGPATPAWAALESGWTLVTDTAADDVVAHCAEHGVELIVAS